MMMGLAVFMIHQLRNQSMIDVANRAVDIPVAQESKFAAPQASSDAESAIAALHNELTEYKNDGEELEIVYKPKSALRMPEGPKEQNPLQINGNKQQVASAGGNNIEEPYHSDLIQTMQSSPFPNFLEEYAQFHRENKEKPNARYIVWR